MIEVIHPGVYSSIQDNGRKGYRHYGIPVSGFMDGFSAHMANLLLGRDPGSALIEAGLSGLVLKFHQPALIVMCGAEAHITVNNTKVKCNRVLKVNTGDILRVGDVSKGVWSYLGVKGLLLSQNVMGSQSQFTSLTEKSRLTKGDCIAFISFPDAGPSNSRINLISKTLNTDVLKVYKGPDFNLIPTSSQNRLFNIKQFLSEQWNRMAYKFQGSIASHDHSMLTSAVLPGTIQWTPSGELFCLMKDAQTSGGYPRVLQLSEDSLRVLAQKRSGEGFKFELFT